MCGIFGAVIAKDSELRAPAHLEQSLERLFRLSESRGKEAAGLAISNDDALAVYKAAIPAREMLKERGYKSFVREAAGGGVNGLAFIGHSRLVTDGTREVNKNNQPVLARGIVGIHNGIIVNHAKLWERHTDLRRQFDVDSEVIFALIRAGLERGQPLVEATRATFSELEGAASIAALFEDQDQLLLATNNGSLYYRYAPATGTFVFASESYILDQFAGQHASILGGSATVHVRPGEGVVVALADLTVQRFTLGGDAAPAASTPRNGHARRRVLDRAAPDPAPQPQAPPVDLSRLRARFPHVAMRDRLKRCRRCVLPETMPFVDFDDTGLCAYCRNHRPAPPHGAEALERLVAPFRRTDGRPDCVVAVSGGRDSMYGLHYVKSVLKLNPVAYTYDWGMVTDLARRNVSRICGKLGIEHILVSADIPQKREFIRKNVDAWLARPSLGTIPLFMAGDKAFFYYLNQTAQQLGVELQFLCENPLERTDFKTGFAGVPPVDHHPDHVARIPLRRQLDLIRFFAREFASNRRYLNASLIDSAKAFAFYYLIKRDYHNVYRYVQWDEETIEKTLIGTYDFELAEDTQTTWRIGDGTAAFYNYIYYAIAGMTENDTFRSNQIRAGAITRDRALELLERDSKPRFPSIDWYLRTIGMQRGIEDVLDVIERAPKLYAR
jgi:glutamine---fructose-6-phosphate transaminase (isomerizing)